MHSLFSLMNQRVPQPTLQAQQLWNQYLLSQQKPTFKDPFGLSALFRAGQTKPNDSKRDLSCSEKKSPRDRTMSANTLSDHSMASSVSQSSLGSQLSMEERR